MVMISLSAAFDALTVIIGIVSLMLVVCIGFVSVWFCTKLYYWLWPNGLF